MTKHTAQSPKTNSIFNKFKHLINRKQKSKNPKKSAPKSPPPPKKRSGVSLLGGLQDINRYSIIWGTMAFFFVVLFARASWLQILNSDYYIKKGNTLITSKRTITTHRGFIYDTNGVPLAANAPLITVVFSPYDYAVEYYALQKRLKNAETPEARANLEQKLANEFDLRKLALASGVPHVDLTKAVDIDPAVNVNNKEAVEQALPKGDGSKYLVLLDKVTPNRANEITSLGFVGVSTQTTDRRYYLQPEPMAQLIGHMHSPRSIDVGLMGIEASHEKVLAGQSGQMLILRGNGGKINEVRELIPTIAGKDIHLTIDARLQYILYKELEELGRVQSARFTSGIIVDIKTGDVMAMSSWPSFNPNDITTKKGVTERNRPVVDTFEPGSVVKPITVATALESGKYSLNTLISTGDGSMQLGDYRVKDGASYGSITMGKLIQKSSNVASAKIALNLPNDAIANKQRQFGLGQKTAMALYDEKSGKVATPTNNATRATLAYGYGQSVTLAQIAQAYTVFANEGALSPLRIDKSKPQSAPIPVISPRHAKDITNMMISVTETGGTGTLASIDGYHVAGKTGTTRRNKPTGGYHTDQYRNIFAGFAPATDPRFVVVILAEDPRVEQVAGKSVAPTFAKVMKESLRLYNVPFDKPLTTKVGK